MIPPVDLAALVRLAGGDDELLVLLRDADLLPPEGASLAPEHAEVVRVAQTLRCELEVNWPGVEIILRMRAELVATRRQLRGLVRALQQSVE